MKEPVFQGLCTAIITPFTHDGIDFVQLEKQLDFQAENGTSAIVIAGTTGENATLEEHEFDMLVTFSVRKAAGRMKCIVGIGGNHTVHCLQKAEFAKAAGADAVLMTTPYYNKTTQAGLVDHFSFVADRVDLPMILYNVPSRTSIGISAETYKILSEHKNINGIKEASGDFSLIARIISECGGELNLWSGNDDQTVPMMALGALGIVSVASNVIPQVISNLCALCLAGSYDKASVLFRQYAGFCRLLFSETNPIPVKSAMELAGMDSGLLRLPLVPMTDRNKEALQQEMKKLGLIC